jgi:hypothetical protein
MASSQEYRSHPLRDPSLPLAIDQTPRNYRFRSTYLSLARHFRCYPRSEWSQPESPQEVALSGTGNRGRRLLILE